MKRIICMIILYFFKIHSASALAECGRLNLISNDILTAVPIGWKLVDSKYWVVPFGHYEDLKYDGDKGLYLLVIGDQNVVWQWKDLSGNWHKNFKVKEAVRLWIMPPDYHQSWRRFFVMKRHVPAEEIFSGKSAKIYGEEGVYWSPVALAWYDSMVGSISASGRLPEHPVTSWRSWKKDIRQILQNYEKLMVAESAAACL